MNTKMKPDNSEVRTISQRVFQKYKQKPDQTQEVLNKELLRCAREGDLQGLQDALKKGADVNAKNNYGETAGHYAAQNGHKDCLELLINAGLNVNARDNGGGTAGYYAARNGHIHCLKLLRKAGLE
ncbi:MAG: ankyrin repeat domain-containing protein [Candidatus Micrarchaeia archaeon]